MIKMGARELFQEMVQRLGKAHGEKETATVLMALNLLLPFGLHAMLDADCASLSAAASRGGAVRTHDSACSMHCSPPIHGSDTSRALDMARPRTLCFPDIWCTLSTTPTLPNTKLFCTAPRVS